MKSSKKKTFIKLYDANYDPEVLNKRNETKFSIKQYNNMDPRDLMAREIALKNLLGSVGEHIVVEPPFYCDYGSNIHVGDNFYANYNLVILDGASVTIGNNCFISPNVGIHTAGHPVDFERRNKGLEYALPVTIGDNVWIGASVIVMPGITIGDNCVIGAGSVVTRDIPSDTVAVGNPCRVLREINEQDKLDFQYNQKPDN